MHWRGPSLIGEARCEGGSAILAMEGEGVRTELALTTDGAGIWRAEAATPRPAILAMLDQSGFTIAPDGVARTERTFQWLPQ